MAVYSQLISSYVDGETITASLFNNEFNQIVASFDKALGHNHDGVTDGSGAPISSLYANAITLGTGQDTDISLTFNANTSDGVLTWMEDESKFTFDSSIDVTGKAFVQSPALGETAGDQSIQADFKAINANNSYLRILDERLSDGTDWTTATKRIQFGIDTNDHAFVGTTQGEAGLRGLILGTHDTSGNEEVFIHCDSDAEVGLYFDNALKLATTATGIDVTGTVTASEGVLIPEGKKLRLGSETDSAGLDIYEDPNGDSFINQYGDGNLIVKGQNILLTNNSDQTLISTVANTAQLFNRNGDNEGLKLETTNTGIDVTGTVTADLLTLHPTGGTSEGGQINFQRDVDDSNAWYVDVFGSTTDTKMRFVNVNDSLSRLEIDDAGIDVTGTIDVSSGLNIGTTLTVSSDGTDTTINEIGDGSLFVGANEYIFRTSDGTTSAVDATPTELNRMILSSGDNGGVYIYGGDSSPVATDTTYSNWTAAFFQTGGLALSSPAGSSSGGWFSCENSITVTDTDSGSESFPDIHLKRNSPSPATNDNLGSIEFWGNRTNETAAPSKFGQIRAQIENVSTGVGKIVLLPHDGTGSADAVGFAMGAFEYSGVDGAATNTKAGGVLRLTSADDTTLELSALDSDVFSMSGGLEVTGTIAASDGLTADYIDLTGGKSTTTTGEIAADKILFSAHTNDTAKIFAEVGGVNNDITSLVLDMQDDGHELIEHRIDGTTRLTVKNAGIDVTGTVTADLVKLNPTGGDSEGGQIEFERAVDNQTAWYVDVHGSSTDTSLRFVDNDDANNPVNRVLMTNTGIDVTGTVDLDNLTISAAQGTAGQVLKSTGAGIEWANDSGGSETLAQTLALGNATGGTDLSVSAADDLLLTASSKIIASNGLTGADKRELQVYVDGAANGISKIEAPDNYLTITSGSWVQMGGSAGFPIVKATADTASLYHGTGAGANLVKLETTSAGIDITGDLDVTGTITSNAFAYSKATVNNAADILYTAFNSFAGKRIINTASATATTYGLPTPVAADIGKSWIICNPTDSLITIDHDASGTANYIWIMDGVTLAAAASSWQIKRGAVVEIVVAAAAAGGGSSTAPNYLIFGAGLLEL